MPVKPAALRSPALNTSAKSPGFMVRKIPSANHLTRLLDNINPNDFAEVFNEGLRTAAKYGGLDRYLVLGKYHLIALDGVWFYQSAAVSCAHCLRHKTKDGETLYYHDMAGGGAGKSERRDGIAAYPGVYTQRRRAGETGLRA
jgi:hypothetical protein